MSRVLYAVRFGVSFKNKKIQNLEIEFLKFSSKLIVVVRRKVNDEQFVTNITSIVQSVLVQTRRAC